MVMNQTALETATRRYLSRSRTSQLIISEIVRSSPNAEIEISKVESHRRASGRFSSKNLPA
jgi:hypothetical protein